MRHQEPLFQRRLFDDRTATFFVSTVHGLEEELVEEILELAEDLKVDLSETPRIASAGVVLQAPWTFAIAMNFSLRCASRILCEVLECDVVSVDDVYAAVEKLNWPSMFSPDKTFVVSSSSSDTKITAATLNLKIKDALVDSFRRQTRERPSVDKDAPQVRVMARLHRRTLSVSLDTTGIPLAQRGYRLAGGDAPVGELLAAGLVRMTGWARVCRAIRLGAQERVYFARIASEARVSKPEKALLEEDKVTAGKNRRIPAEIPLAPEFVDPMCGTGTFSIEAALQLMNRRPQIERKFFAYQNLNLFPENALKQMESLRRQLRSQELSIVDCFEKLSSYRSKVLARKEIQDEIIPPIRCSDRDKAAVFAAQKNADAAGVRKLISFQVSDVSEIHAPAPEGVVVLNPPYGMRLGDSEHLGALYKSIGDTLKQNFKGWQGWILAGEPQLAASVGLRATRRKKVFNGGLECLWLQYVLF
jgi:putative N6-adenine-specific DNA methylase